MIPNGTYRARAVDIQFAFADTGTEQVAVTFELLDDGEHKGAKITWYGFFTDSAQTRTVEGLRTCGCAFEGGDITDTRGFDKNEVDIVVQIESFQGKTQSRVRWVNARGLNRPAVKNAMSVAQKSDFASRMKSFVLATSPTPRRDGKPAPGVGGGRGGGYPADWDKGGL